MLNSKMERLEFNKLFRTKLKGYILEELLYLIKLCNELTATAPDCYGSDYIDVSKGVFDEIREFVDNYYEYDLMD